MDLETKLLFATPIWQVRFDDARMMNRMLLLDGMNYQAGDWGFLDLPGEGIAQLKKAVYDSAAAIAKERNIAYSDLQIRSRQNPMKPGEYDSPHHHPESDLLGVYYVKARPGSGDILFHDARGSVPTMWQDPLVVDDTNGRSGRVIYRVNPEEGKFVMFPGYLIHSVEPNLSDDVRMSIIFEFRFVP